MPQQLQQLTQAYNSLLAQFKSHIHNGTDSQKISTVITQTVYSGTVASNAATSGIFPSGWSCVVGTGGSVGIYTITHTLGTANFTVVATCTTIYNYVTVKSQSSTTFQIEAYNIGVGGSVSPTDSGFNFILSTT